MSEYIVRMPSDMPYEIQAELNAWYVNSEPIVRCSDCEYYEDYTGCCTRRDNIAPMAAKPDGFCAWGESEMANKTGGFVIHGSQAERTCGMKYSGGVPDFLSLDTWMCSECGCETYDVAEPNYCPNCGARVEQ